MPKIARTAACLLTVSFAHSVNAQDVAMASMTCADFYAQSEETAVYLLMWMEGYATAMDGSDVYSAERYQQVAILADEQCVADPSRPILEVWQEAKKQ